MIQIWTTIRKLPSFKTSALAACAVCLSLSAQAQVVEVNATGTTQYFSEDTPAGTEGTVFSKWVDKRSAEINPSISRTLEFKFTQAPEGVYEIHAFQDYKSEGGQLVPLMGFGNQNFMRIYCNEPFRTLSDTSENASSSGGTGRLNTSVTIGKTDCPSGTFSVIAFTYGGGQTGFTSPLALSINELDATAPQIPSWENPNLDACQKQELMKAAGVPVPMSIKFSCMRLRVQ